MPSPIWVARHAVCGINLKKRGYCRRWRRLGISFGRWFGTGALSQNQKPTGRNKMMQLTRRKLFAGAAAASAATALSPLTVTHAAAPPAGKQAPGFYRYKVGSLECTQATDGIAQFPMPDGFIKNASKEEIKKALEAGYLPGDKMTVPFNPMAINTGSKLIVIDTGYSDKGPKTAGQFHKNLGGAG